MKILSLDIGGTNIRSAVVKGSRLEDYRKVRTPMRQKETIKRIFEIAEGYIKVDVICVSTAGFERNGRIVNSLNNDMDGALLGKLLNQKFKKKIFIENDANCAALAELRYGAGRGKRNFVLLTLGSGIGGGVIADGRLLRGRGGAVEVGSMRIGGEKYIWEDVASGDSSVFLARKSGLVGITSLELAKRADRGDKKAKKIYDAVGKNLGVGISNLAYIFDPEMIIIGGGFSRVKHIYPEMYRTFKRLYNLKPRPDIVKAELGDDAGLVGAALLVKNQK